jgi:hypothetical protein
MSPSKTSPRDKKTSKSTKLSPSDILINELSNLDVTKTQGFSFNTMETYAKVTKCFDFNTIELVFKFNKIFVKYNCIISGIKEEEKKPDVILKKECEKKQKLENLILNQIVYIKCRGFDKFGRVYIDLTKNNKNIIELLN